ncbi:proton-conducting transporter membrane subunit [Prosthecobacter sp.]|uniref:proton-conducting transporter transmembrane domain-containing protein n=1 Tax=Prosthecobacter sp. TaxID=1965333 RepID=UPI003784400E
MEHLSLPFCTAGLTSLLGGVVGCWLPRGSRKPAIMAALITLLCFGGAAREALAAGHARLLDPLLPFFAADGLNAVPMAFYAALTLFVVVLAPKRDAEGRVVAGMLLVSLATQVAYASANLFVLVAGWCLSCVPFALGMVGGRRETKLANGILLASCAALGAAAIMLRTATFEDLSTGGRLAFGLIIAGVVLRKGLFPFHAGVVQSFEKGPLLPKALLFNGHLGVLLVARAESAGLPHIARQAFDVLGIAAVATIFLASLRAFAEKKPRRLLAFVCISQASFMLAGITTANAAGITGALVHWLVVAVASTGLICIVRVLEVRVSSAEDPMMHLGLAAKAPRLATFFLVCGLALVGLPGTLGYCGEELMFHGMLANHMAVGITLLVATVFNAINLIRLFNILFLGVLPKHVIDIPDALPRERWPLTACVVFLIFGGLFPSVIIGWREDAAEVIAKALGLATGAAH